MKYYQQIALKVSKVKVLINLMVPNQPKGHKIDLRGHQMINGLKRPKKKALLHKSLFIFLTLSNICYLCETLANLNSSDLERIIQINKKTCIDSYKNNPSQSSLTRSVSVCRDSALCLYLLLLLCFWASTFVVCGAQPITACRV